MPFVQTNPIQMADNTANALVVREKVGGINYVEIDTINGVEVIRLLPTGVGDIKAFENSAEGITRYVGISGYKTSGSLTEARLAVGVHTDQYLSIYNAQGYQFDNIVSINSDGATLELWDSAGGFNDQRFQLDYDNGLFRLYSLNNDGAIRKDNILVADAGTATVGIGVVAVQKFEIGSNDNSNRISIYHDNLNGVINWDDGSLYFESREGTNANTAIILVGHGTGRAEILITDGASGSGRIRQDGGILKIVNEDIGDLDLVANNREVRIQPTGEGNIECFVASAEGVTRYLGISGYRTSGSLTEVRLGVGVHADQVLSFYNAQGYYFDTNVGINVSLPLATIHTLGTAIFDMTDNTGGVWKVVEGAREYIYISTLNGSEAIDFGGPSDAVEYNFRGDGHVSVQGGLKFTNKLLAGDGFTDATAARAAEDSLLGHLHVFVTPSGSPGNDFFAFGDKTNGVTVLVTNDGSVNAQIDQDETGGMDLCAGRTALCRWDQGTDSWYYV